MKNRNDISTTILLVIACVGNLTPNAFGVVPSPDGLLFYDPDPRTVQGEFYTTDGKGGISLLRQQVGWRTSWTHIIPGKFGGNSTFTDLLFYDAAAGLGQFYKTDGKGGIHLLGEQPSWRTGWTHIIPGKFGGTSGSTDLLFYDAAAGLGQFYTVNGPGRISLLKQHTDWRTSWTQIVPGRFRNLPPSPTPVTDLLFYDAAAGTLEFYAINGPGSISLLKRHTGWGSSWTQIIPGKFGGSTGFTDLLFYDAASGKGEFYTTGGHGELFPLNKYTDWRTSWTQIIPAQFKIPPHTPAPPPAPVTDLLFYDAGAGTGEFYTINGPGRISLLKQHSNWRRTWARIIPGLFALGGSTPKYPLLPVPEKYRGPSGEPGQILLEGRAFKVGAYHGKTDDEADWHVHLDLPSATQTDLIAATGVPLGKPQDGFWCEIMVNDMWETDIGLDRFFSADVSKAFRLTKPGSDRTAWDLMLQAIALLNKGNEQDFSAFSTLIDGRVWLQGPFVKDAAAGHGWSEIHPLDSIAFAIDKAGGTVTAQPGQPDWPRGTIKWRVAWFANSRFHRITNEPFSHKQRTTTWMLPLPLGDPIGGVDVVETKIELLDVPTGTRYLSRGVAQEPTWQLVSTRPGRPPSLLRVSATMKEPDKFGGLAVREYQITLKGVIGP